MYFKGLRTIHKEFIKSSKECNSSQHRENIQGRFKICSTVLILRYERYRCNISDKSPNTIKDSEDCEDVEECIGRHGAIIDDFCPKSNRIFLIFSVDNSRNSARLSLTNERPPRSRKILREPTLISKSLTYVKNPSTNSLILLSV